VTGWGSITYKNFAGVFSVASPYNVVYTESENGATTAVLTPMLYLVVGVAIVAVSLLIYWLYHYCCCGGRRRGLAEDNSMNGSVEIISTAPTGGDVPQVIRSPNSTGSYSAIPRSPANFEGTIAVRTNPITAI